MAHVTPASALVSLHQVAFHFDDGATLFDCIDLTFDRTPTAIVGRNGTGKSLLARLIAGDLAPSAGIVERFGSVALVKQAMATTRGETIAQAAGLASTFDALARLSAGTAGPQDLDRVADRWDLATRVRIALAQAGMPALEVGNSADSLSEGQRARVAMIGALLSDADFLVLDEPTNHLDSNGRAWLRDQLQQWRGGLLVISHDRQMLREVGRIVELTPHGPRVYGGNYDAFREQREAGLRAAQSVLDHARTERARERRRLQREHDTIQRRAAGTLRYAETANVSRDERAAMKGKAKEAMGHVRRAQQWVKGVLDDKVSDAATRVLPEHAVLLSLPGAELPPRRTLFTLDAARLPWLQTHDPAAWVTWTAEGPVRVAVIGPNGCGKSTLLRMLAGEASPLSGMQLTHVPCAYLDQRLDLLDPERSVVEQLGLLDTPLLEGELRSRLALLQINAQCATQPIRNLSGGERLKAALACALWRGTPAQLLLLDEPTNHLDLESTLAFESALADFSGAIVAVSHDTDFLVALRPTHTMRWTTEGWLYERAEGA